jgi:4-amino-4-deoxy-L-arabinose transferase-like glycosyltransferase
MQGIWMLCFGTSAGSVLALLAFLAAALALLLCEAVRAETSPGAGWIAGAVFLTLPEVVLFSSEVMAELPVALFVFLAVLEFARYLDSPGWKPAALFGVWAGLALLGKGTGIELALVPVFAILFGRRWDVLRRGSFWLPALVVVAVAGPWYFGIPGAHHEKVEAYGGVNFVTPRLISTFTNWYAFLGVMPAVLALVGMLAPQARRAGSAIWVTGFALMASAYTCRLFVDVWEPRHLVSTLPVLMLFASAGGFWLMKLPRIGSTARVGLGVAALSAAVAMNLRGLPVKPSWGYRSVAQELTSNPAYSQSVLLVCDNSTGEGAFIAEVAMQDGHPGHYVLRASKFLAATDWSGTQYRPLYDSPGALLEAMESAGVGIAVLGPESGGSHCQMLREALNRSEGRWETLPGQGRIAIYGRTGMENRPAGRIEITDPLTGVGQIGNQTITQ